MSNIQTQYKNTNIEKLIDSLNKVFIKYINEPINNFITDIYSLDNADTLGLDLWGYILNFPRVIKYTDTENPNITSKELSDDEYRLVLQILALNCTTSCTINDLNKLLNQLFKNYNIECFVVDNQDMTFVNYVFLQKIPDWLKAAFTNYDLLPHPQGVGTNIIEATSEFFGFDGQELTNFYQAIFYEEKNIDSDLFGFEGQELTNFNNAIFKL